jgi:hypothetical protein
VARSGRAPQGLLQNTDEGQQGAAVSHETRASEQALTVLAEDLEPTVLSYREFRRREDLRAWYRRRREYELTGAAFPSARAGNPPRAAAP